MTHILAVGIAALDIINIVDRYPGEDEEMRAIAQRLARGGNAANTACVLAQFGHRVDFAGVLADDPHGRRIEQDLLDHHVSTHFCQRVEFSKAPTSYITLNRANGSRTIVHFRDLPEFDFTHFSQIPIEEFDWLHFEGRNVAETAQMLRHAHERRIDQPISVEVEKDREGIDQLFPLADILLFSRSFMTARGYGDPTALFDAVRTIAPAAVLICTRGAQGAVACDADGNEFASPAFTPPEVVDTIGAGDTFNAGIIDALSQGGNLNAALEHACRLAGKKVGQAGFDRLQR
ncbi:MAG: carbohydrate kinase [Pseudomonadota bacterium]|nr:MAG: carbohydrate kinase [Pseudomonadota bacterium]